MTENQALRLVIILPATGVSDESVSSSANFYFTPPSELGQFSLITHRLSRSKHESHECMYLTPVNQKHHHHLDYISDFLTSNVLCRLWIIQTGMSICCSFMHTLQYLMSQVMLIYYYNLLWYCVIYFSWYQSWVLLFKSKLII